MKNPFDLQAPMVTSLTANVYADGVRICFGELVADRPTEVAFHTAVFIPAHFYEEFRKLVTLMEPKLAEIKNAVQN
jgi:hypothetical protein